MLTVYVYVVVRARLGIRTRNGRLPNYGAEYVDYMAHQSLDVADEAAVSCMKALGGRFTLDTAELKPGHVLRAWSSAEDVVWVERLELG